MSKNAFLLIYMFICFVSSAQEINLHNIKGSIRPYNIIKDSKAYTLLPVDCNNMQNGKYPDLCERLFQFHVFFSAWPDIRTPSRDTFIILTDDIAILRGDTLHMCEEVVFYVDRESGEIIRFEQKGVTTYKCNKQDLLKIESLRKKDLSVDEFCLWNKYDHLGPSNMVRIEEGDDIIWEYSNSILRVENKMAN